MGTSLRVVDEKLAKQPSSWELLVSKGYYLLESGRLDEAEWCARKAAVAEPASEVPWVLKYLIAMEANLWEEAATAIKTAVSINPLPDYLALLAELEYELSQPESAKVSASKALLQDPDHVEALFHLGRALKKLGDYVAAIEALDRAASIEPKEPVILRHLALAQARVSPREACSTLERALELDPDYPEAQEFLSWLRAEANRKED